MTRRMPGQRERGAIAVLVAFTIVVMMLAVGLVLDLGHLHIVKNELQNAADACALSGARELNDLGEGALERITAVAMTTGERNRVGLGSDAVDVPDENVTFADALEGPYSHAVASTTRYIRCETATLTVPTWLMHLGGTQSVTVSAFAIARRAPGQTLCAIPLALCKEGATPLQWGNWYTGRMSPGNHTHGMYDWIRFPGMQGAADIADLLAGDGLCDTMHKIVDGQGGMLQGVAQAWNTRFGLYSGGYKDVSHSPPDGTGYAYTPVQLDRDGQPICPGGVPSGTWPPDRQCVVPTALPSNAYPDFIARHNGTHDPYNPAANLDENGKIEGLPGSPLPSASDTHRTMGQDRRLVFAPVIDCSTWQPGGHNMPVVGYACALMLNPIPDTDQVVIEFRGMMDDPANNCGTAGFPGTSGAPVPSLVR